MKKFLYIFILINFLLTIFYIDTWENGNTTARALPVITYFENHTFQLDKYHTQTCDISYVNNHYYPEKAPLPTFIVMPFFWLFKTLGIIKMHDGSFYGKEVFVLGSVICSVLPFLFIILITFKHLNKKKLSFSPVLLCMLPLYGSFIFVFSASYFAHIFAGFLLLLSYILLKKEKYLLSGVLLGLSFLSEFTVGIALPIWAFQIYFNKKNFKKSFDFITGFLPSLIFIFIYNFYFTGNPFDMIYKYYINANPDAAPYSLDIISLSKIWKITFGVYRGVFFYAPFLILILLSVFKIKYFKQFFKSYLPLFCLIYFTYIALSATWYGGWTYGPRYLTCIVILIFYEGISLVSKINFSKILFWCLSIFGLICALMAKFTVLYSLPSEINNPITQVLIPNILKQNFNENNLLTMLLGTKPIIANAIWILLFVLSLIFLTVLFKKLVKEEKLTERNC
ncbi:MAG: hypothetical protein WC223_09330 [Bacteroidales bacterium]